MGKMLSAPVRDYSWLVDSVMLLAILGGLFFIFLGNRPLFVPDEGRYAEIAREMVTSSDYLTPYLNAIKYFEKPILFYWLAAAAIKLAGTTLWSLRSVNALLGLFGCLYTYFTARRFYDRQTGLLASFILGTATLYFVMAHTISLDLTVSVFLMACLYSFLLGIQQPDGLKRRLYIWSAAACAAWAVLTKGLIGIVFPLMIIGAWIALLGDWRLLARLYLPSSVLVFLLVAVPWHVLVNLRNPEFFYFYFIEQHILRYTMPNVGHYQPAWFFIPTLLVGFFPWMVFLPQAIANQLPTWRTRKVNATSLFFILWAVLIFGFFSFSKSKLIPYILPVFPPLAILTANYLANSRLHSWGVRIGYFALVALSLLMAGVFYFYTRHTALPDALMAQHGLDIAVTILLIGAIVSCIIVFRQPAQATAVTVMTAGLFLLMVLYSMPAIDNRTIRPLAETLKPILKPQDDVITFNQYYQDLPFYLERRVSILNWRNELSYGMEHQDTHEWMINDTQFWQRWDSSQRVFVVISLEEFEHLKANHPTKSFYLLNKTVTNALISNQK